MRQGLSLTEFRDDFRDCYGELSTQEVIENVDLTQYLHWLEKCVFAPRVPIIMRGAVSHFRRLISDRELEQNSMLCLKLSEIERRLEGRGPPSPPRCLKFRVIEVEQVPTDAIGV
jgi:hypothetical protein